MDVMLLGEGIHLDQVKIMLETCGGYNIVSEISSLHQVNEILKKKKIKKKKINIICCMLGDHEKEAFLDVMMCCHKINLSFLHPVFALNKCEFRLSETPKIRTYGFPGSGNMLISDFILEHIPSPKRSYLEDIYCMIGSHFINFFHYVIESAFQSTFKLMFSTDSSITYSTTNEYRGVFRIYQNNENQFLIHNFPCPSFTWDSVISCHGFLNEKTIDFYEKKKFSQLIIIRHPLDTIFSNLKKLDCIQKARKYEIIELLSRYYSDFMNVVLKNKHRIHVIKYEDIVSDTVNVLKQLSEHCRMNVSENRIIEWKDKKMFTLLPRVISTHFQGGGTGKWKNYFDKTCFEIFEQNNILSMVEELGYPKPNLVEELNEAFPHQNQLETSFHTIKNKLDFWYHPYWNINGGYKRMFTPKNNKVYYRFYDQAKQKQKDFKKNSLPLALLVDSFYDNKKTNKFLSEIKNYLANMTYKYSF